MRYGASTATCSYQFFLQELIYECAGCDRALIIGAPLPELMRESDVDGSSILAVPDSIQLRNHAIARRRPSSSWNMGPNTKCAKSHPADELVDHPQIAQRSKSQTEN